MNAHSFVLNTRYNLSSTKLCAFISTVPQCGKHAGILPTIRMVFFSISLGVLALFSCQ